MKTVSSVCATGSITALSVVGLTIASKDDTLGRREGDMTTVVSYPRLHNTFDSPFPLPPARHQRLDGEGDNGSQYTSNSNRNDRRRPAKKRPSSSVAPSASLGTAMDHFVRTDSPRQATNTTGTQSTTWLRRLSSSVSTSRDSSRTSSRPGSAAYSTANGSVALSHTSSTAPMFPNSTSASLPPNKLVKRTTSTRSVNGFSSPASASKLPIPTFRRPATSRQRSATLQEQLSGAERGGQNSVNGGGPRVGGSPWRHYFTPWVESEWHPTRRRSSTNIPNPIIRLYPDRKYTPTLISAKEIVRLSAVGIEVESSDEGSSLAESEVAGTSASSPFPPQTVHFEESNMPRRSFSIGDLLSSGPQPLWRRPSSKGSIRSSRDLRKLKSKAFANAQSTTGHTFSHGNGRDPERPAKRRGLSDPNEARRSIYSSSSSSFIAPKTNAYHEIGLNLGHESPLLNDPLDDTFTDNHNPRAQTPSPVDQQGVPFATYSRSSPKPARLSTTHSEVTSTVGSDSEHRSLDDYSTDYQSDNAYDSIQTRTTHSNSGRRGPHIETIFDESPPALSSGRSTKLRDFLKESPFSSRDHNGLYRHSIIEEEGSVMSTPVRSLQNMSVDSTPSRRHDADQLFSSSPPAMNLLDLDDLDWDATDNNTSDQGLGIERAPPSTGAMVLPSLPFRFGPSLRPAHPRSAGSTPLRSGAALHDRTNLFDWSEQQPSPSHPNESPPRPRTVHGKKDQDSRGSRPAGRRPTSGMHARSHSVPVVPDVDGNRSSVVANKFGTWGVGSKAVTEDWNEDFDFDEPPSKSNGHGSAEMDDRRIDSGHEMFVPRSIREQQENVVANISLLREWGLLIEELKELRIRAVALDMFHGQYAQALREVDAMIELADQETEEHTLEPRRSPPSSPGFDYSLFEDTPVSTPNNGGSGRTGQPAVTLAALGGGSSDGTLTATPQSARLMSRPRKDSELVAQAVIAALQSKRLEADTKKVPFDTATLRHIVPYVNSLKRQVKDALRETEGLYSSPHRRSSPGARQHH